MGNNNVNDDLEKRLENPEFRKEFYDLEQQFMIIEAVIKAKHRFHSTTEELSKLTGIRLAELRGMEKGTGNPSLDSLIKLAQCLDMKLELTLIPK